jgi:uncharacterized protein (DUF433 family)
MGECMEWLAAWGTGCYYFFNRTMIDSTHNYVVPVAGGGWRVEGTRVTLTSVVHAYWNGQSAEEIVCDFPALNLEQVHGALAFYLRHRNEVDAFLASQDAQWEQLQRESSASNASLVKRLRKIRSDADRPRRTRGSSS